MALRAKKYFQDYDVEVTVKSIAATSIKGISMPVS